jgi:hypothetical protein
MNKKERFLRTVESLCDHWPLERASTTMRAAVRYEEELLPENTGIAALQFVCGVSPVKAFLPGSSAVLKS